MCSLVRWSLLLALSFLSVVPGMRVSAQSGTGSLVAVLPGSALPASCAVLVDPEDHAFPSFTDTAGSAPVRAGPNGTFFYTQHADASGDANVLAVYVASVTLNARLGVQLICNEAECAPGTEDATITYPGLPAVTQPSVLLPRPPSSLPRAAGRAVHRLPAGPRGQRCPSSPPPPPPSTG